MGNAPKLRFEGFTGDWNLCKFGDFTWDSGKRNKDNLDLEPYAITNENGFVPQSEAHDEFGYMKDTDRRSYKIVTPRSFAYNPARINVGSIGYYEGTNNVIVSSLYEVFKTADSIEDKFLWHWLKSDNLPKWINQLQEGSVRLYFFYDKLCESCLFIPLFGEQERIADILDEIDRLIDLHQQKYRVLTKSKQFYLQNMFPQSGESVPKLRFAGFTGEWERRKLGDLVQFSKGAGYSKTDLQSIGIPIILYGRLYTKYETVISDVDTFVDAKQGSVFSHGGEVIVPASGETAEDISVASVVEKSGIILGGDLNIITPPADLDSVFLAISITNGQPHLDMAKMAQGKSIVHLHNSDLEKITLAYPGIFEQVQISAYIRQIEHYINLCKCKIDALKAVKQFLLQHMFV